MPSLNPRTPSPNPRISSGILRPPKRISTTTRMISQCIGNSILPPALCQPESSTLPTRSTSEKGAKSEYNTLVALPPGHAFAVQILEQRDGIFACDAGQVFKSGHGDSLSFRLFVGHQFAAQFGQRVAVKNQFRGDAQQRLIAQQKLQQLFRSPRLNGELTENFLGR